MKFSEIVSITGLPGLYRVLNSKSNGVVVTGLEDGKSQFISARVHAISNLESISMYMKDGETRELKFIFSDMLKMENDTPPADSKASNDELRNYFKKIEPNHDTERVHVSDIKKAIKWYHILKSNNLIKSEEDWKKEEGTAEEEDKKEG